MASLTDIASRHKVDLGIKEKTKITHIFPSVPSKSEGRIRRPWLTDTENSETIKSVLHDVQFWDRQLEHHNILLADSVVQSCFSPRS